MSIRYVQSSNSFFLNTKDATHAFCIDKFGYLQTLHFGAKTGDKDSLLYLDRPVERGFAASIAGAKKRSESLDLIENEFPIFGSGDFRHGAILTKDQNGNRLEDLRYQSHEILKNKPKIDGMPSLTGGETLKITLSSRSLTVDLYYTVYENENAFTRRTVVRNTSTAPISVERLMSCNLDLPSSDYDVITLYGRHCSERNVERSPLGHGVFSVLSNRGASSHQHNPFLALAAKNADENQGEVIGFNLVYGGNFLMSCEVDQFDTLRVQSGFNPFDFSYLLEAGNSLETPETVIVYSDSGLGGMSRSFHNLYRENLINKKYVNASRPIVVNSWEAVYFGFNNENLFALIDSCKGLGIDTFVLDDGWFGVRNSDTSGLGDWVVNTNKLKGGLNPIIERCRENGLKFGLWFEPEMVSPDSDLFRSHPEFCIHVEGISPALGRDQLILDLSQREVLDYLKSSIGAILKNHDISYVKWDMNRHMTDVCSPKLPPSRQQELRHRYMLGFYELIEYFVTTFPDILFEGCSGGGGRFDPSMLYYFPQIWTSDCSDAFERGKIQYGTSLCYPLSANSGHVSVCPNHQTGRITPISTRGNIAMLGSFGYELNPLVLTKDEIKTVKIQTETYKKVAPLIMEGDLYRLKDPFESNDFCFLVVSRDKSKALLTFMNGSVSPNAPKKRLHLVGLDENKTYKIKAQPLSCENANHLNLIEDLSPPLILSGRTLKTAGLPLPQFLGDYASLSYEITEV